MGGDGGCIATQREFMRGTYGSAHSKGGWAQGQNHGSGTTGGDAEHGDFTNRRRATRVRSCALTGDALKAPVVSDQFGQLFNKLDVLERLSSKSLPEAFSHIRGLRDLIDVKSTPPKGEKDYVHGDGAPYCQCPLTGASFDGSEPFVVVRTSGWLLAQKAISELGERALQDEYGPFTKEDLVAAAPDPDDVREASRALAEKRAAAKAKKKAAKRAKGVVDAPKPEKKRMLRQSFDTLQEKVNRLAKVLELKVNKCIKKYTLDVDDALTDECHLKLTFLGTKSCKLHCFPGYVLSYFL